MGRLARRLAVATTLTAVTAGLVTSAATSSPDAGAATRPIIFGASGGSQVATLSRDVGAPLAMHVYGRLNGPVLNGRMINLATNVSWRSVASAKAGTATYGDLVRWANGLKGRPGPILLAFSHEPMGASSDNLGSAADFVAAWKKVRAVFQAQGVRNVEYTWTVTSHSFRVKASSEKYALKWYPGDAYVDNVATAAYNWYTCGEGRGQWLSLANRAADALAFAKAHHKPYVLAEWASQSGPKRAQWLQDARVWMLANQASIRGAFYYQTPTPRKGCNWRLNTPAEYQAFGQMAKDRTHFGG